ncbi:calcitonin receptor, partial [Plakobranchus ocellatus]
ITCHAQTSSDRMCRAKFGTFAPASFDLYACAMCYTYLTNSEDVAVLPYSSYLYVRTDQTVYPKETLLTPDAENATFADMVCRTLDHDGCISWKSCCKAAHTCCQSHIQSPPGRNDSCPRTWDGFGCWEDTRPGKIVYIGCPAFLKYSVSSSKYTIV